MLTGLSIRDFVLIDQLELALQPGLTVLTGETGAGKSILLDALGAACGARAESGMVRQGAEKANVTASFTLAPHHPALALLRENEIDSEGGDLILRRSIGSDGRSKAFINDQPVGVQLLREIGGLLVEVHGQFDTHGLLDASTHRPALDRFAGLDLTALGKAYQGWQKALEAEETARAALAQARHEEEYLRDSVAELKKLAAEPGEEARLIEQKKLLQNSEKLARALSEATEAVSGEQGAELLLAAASRALAKAAPLLGETANGVLAQLDTARDAVAEVSTQLDHLHGELGSAGSLEQVEERLYALRAVARKHQTTAEELPALAERLQNALEQLDHGEDQLGKLASATLAAKASYDRLAQDCSEARRKAARKLDKVLMAELAPLKMERAVFTTALESAPPGPYGVDAVTFTVATNPGAPAGPINRIASGGELARFMLALKVVLAGSSDAVALVFDEVDQGVGGAVAAAVGERLARLAANVPVLVVTHSPQVAAKAAQHWRVAKAVKGKLTTTSVTPLSPADRREELARMLSGETVTAASRAAATALLDGTAA